MLKIHKLVSSSLGIGYIGKGGGSVAAVATCLCWYLAYKAGGDGFVLWQPVIVLMLSVLGVWSAGAVEPSWGKDDKKVVIDEVAGMCISLLYISPGLVYFGLGFILFRFFDIVKPFYIRKMEDLQGGWGVMLDDIVAGIYTNLILHLLLYFKIV